MGFFIFSICDRIYKKALQSLRIGALFSNTVGLSMLLGSLFLYSRSLPDLCVFLHSFQSFAGIYIIHEIFYTFYLQFKINNNFVMQSTLL
jgi:hypothetical protein